MSVADAPVREASSPMAAVLDDARNWSAAHPESVLLLFALVDPAQDRSASQRLSKLSQQHASLLASFSAPQDSAPQLLLLGAVDKLSEETWRLVERSVSSAACTFLLSGSQLNSLQLHLGRFVDVRLSGGVEMLLALWDPAILGTLVGQTDDSTLHVPGPVLSPTQRNDLLSPLVAWWYGDREQHWHRIAGSDLNTEATRETKTRLTLTQAQEDALVEASVPDQVLFHLQQNRPSLLNNPDLPHANYHRFVRQVLPAARMLGLEGMRDLVNFVALCLLYRQRMETDPQILQLLNQVQRKTLTMDEAMKRMPE
ncbi:DUF4123 domain-containing protein [Ideonella dechloratans]|uniref:DUF4123 domain-containing protein n=1 Tax=Ideonella dechloratans TaxID=36863 RepID=UPI0035B462AE